MEPGGGAASGGGRLGAGGARPAHPAQLHRLCGRPGVAQSTRQGDTDVHDFSASVAHAVVLSVWQPVHAFDLATVGGSRIVVRRARAGEMLTTLDGVARTLTPGALDEVRIARPRLAPVAPA